MTIIYLIRHSEKYRGAVNISNDDDFQLCNEKMVLSSRGEEKARLLSQNKEMSNIDVVIASNYVRSVSTAKYIADVNNTDVKIVKEFGERVYGINSLDEIVPDFEIRQYDDAHYKIGYGESRHEVEERMDKALGLVLETYRDKRIAIVSHGTAMCFLLCKWCDVFMRRDDTGKYIINIKYNDKVIFNRNFNAPEVFKLTFDDEFNLFDIENIEC